MVDNMEPRPKDNLLWLGLGSGVLTDHEGEDTDIFEGIIGFFAIRAAAAQLQRVRTVTEVTHVVEQSRVISQETEDGG